MRGSRPVPDASAAALRLRAAARSRRGLALAYSTQKRAASIGGLFIFERTASADNRKKNALPAY